jgi:hypothetical protein
MAHFAQIAEDGTVLNVIVVNNEVLLDDNGVEQEQLGRDFCHNLLGGTWVQTSYNDNFRLRFAAVGGRYDAQNDVFIHASPYASWTLDENYVWQAPVPQPADGNFYVWSEDTTSWVINPSPAAPV